MVRISELPFRPRLAVCLLYLAATGLALAAGVLAGLRGFSAGLAAAAILEFVILAILIRRA